jgi:ferredoxin--NADP+ reductase
LLPSHPDEVEFYIVQVKADQEEIPALTPRLFLKGVGDRLFRGRKFTGRYTLDGGEPTDNIVFLSTGTGEAPQNKMTNELLRDGHSGEILNLVCVRYLKDLAYLEHQDAVEAKFANYRYKVLTTREPDDLANKRYLQGLIRDGDVEKMLGEPLDPGNTHVFLCGNPAMIGLPKWDGDKPLFPPSTGVCELLHEKGFTIDHLKVRGNVHYEEYWTERD